MKEAGYPGVEIGTVDQFQVRTAVYFYSPPPPPKKKKMFYNASHLQAEEEASSGEVARGPALDFWLVHLQILLSIITL